VPLWCQDPQSRSSPFIGGFVVSIFCFPSSILPPAASGLRPFCLPPYYKAVTTCFFDKHFWLRPKAALGPPWFNMVIGSP
jgi:hypothetical protein